MARKHNIKTRKHHKQNNIGYVSNQDKAAKKGTHLKCRLKTCRAKKYQSVYGASHGGSIRSEHPVFL